MKITLDTNILIDAFNLARKEVDQENAKNLLAYHRKKICEIFITTRVDSDTQSKILLRSILLWRFLVD